MDLSKIKHGCVQIEKKWRIFLWLKNLIQIINKNQILDWKLLNVRIMLMAQISLNSNKFVSLIKKLNGYFNLFILN